MTDTDTPRPDDNPLLTTAELPQFAAIRPEHVEPAVRATLAAARAALTRAEAADAPTPAWLADVEAIHESVQRVFGPVSHLNSVVSTPELRDAFNRCLPLVTAFDTDLGQSTALYEHYHALQDRVSPGAEAAAVAHGLRDFRLAGVALPPDEKRRFGEISLALADLSARFEQNLMDATDAFHHVITDPAELAGLPDGIVERAARAARDAGIDGWRLSLDAPTYQAVLTHAESAALRELYYRAWVTRASELGPDPERWNNGPVIDEILALRAEAAQLLGFENYAALSLATKMADSPAAVLEFLSDLGERSRERARAELGELERLAGRPLAAWDVGYFAEQLRQQRFGLSEEALRAYFPLPRVLDGLFAVTERLFGVAFRPRDSAAAWHPDVTAYDVIDVDGQRIGSFFVDLYARPNKRGGAWMDSARNRSRLRGAAQPPIAYLVCNFTPPHDTQPSYLTHGDVVTLFHEFGHSLHHLLTEIDVPSVAGINGVEWDAVELPSQFFENYAWLPDVLREVSAHRDSGEPLPDETIARLRESRSFLSGLAMVRQLEFALFDFALHTQQPVPAGADVARILADARARVAVVDVPDFNRFQNGFAHIFGGGYAAGYYSYKWAEVLAADAFAAFESAGVFDAATARRFRREILATGGSRSALASFVEFRGREPALEPLLRQAGIAA